MSRRPLSIALVVALLLAAGCADDTDRRIEPFAFTEVRREACPESRFECVTITVPRDHFNTGGPTWEVTYAIQPAGVERRGTFVTITGGPGSGGIYSADSYTDVMSNEITDYNDIVFLNQRGSGTFQPLRCDQAAADFYRAEFDPAAPGAGDEAEAMLRTFVDGCVAEGEIDVDDLPYYGTRQAAEDLELVRRHLDVDQLTLYGESYGTQFVQTYAAAHPDRVAALIVDGVVDLTLEGTTWYDEAARAYHDVLIRTLNACEADDACAADAGEGDADLVAAYDDLAAQLAEAPISYEMPLADGTTSPRELTLTDLEIAAGGNVGSFSGRASLLRVLNAALGGNPVPLGRMALQYVYLDPESLELEPDESWSDALYYAVECQDYSFYPDGGTPRERLDRWLADFVAGDSDELRLGGVALGDLPCLYWPAQPGRVERPTPITDPPYPTFVLTSDTDPATPMVSALRVFERIDDAYLVVLQDGPHVIFDWGYPCVDDLIAGFVGSGTRPDTKVTICDGDILDPYVPIAPDTDDEVEALVDDPIGTLRGIEQQLLNQVDYIAWDGEDELAVGCDFGGAARYETGEIGTEITLDECEFTDGVATSGTVSTDDETGTVTMDVDTEWGSVTFTDDGEQATATGTWNRDDIDLSE
jgi:pimeloyl-ACP methyl ester carboxylesterase